MGCKEKEIIKLDFQVFLFCFYLINCNTVVDGIMY